MSRHDPNGLLAFVGDETIRAVMPGGGLIFAIDQALDVPGGVVCELVGHGGGGIFRKEFLDLFRLREAAIVTFLDATRLPFFCGRSGVSAERRIL